MDLSRNVDLGVIFKVLMTSSKGLHELFGTEMKELRCEKIFIFQETQKNLSKNCSMRRISLIIPFMVVQDQQNRMDKK